LGSGDLPVGVTIVIPPSAIFRRQLVPERQASLSTYSTSFQE